MRKILCLDIDDAIYPNNNAYFGRLDDAHTVLELNMKRIEMIVEKYDMDIFIISSWWTILILNPDKTISYEPINDYNLDNKFYEDEYKAFNIMKPILDGKVIGMSKGDRYEDIAKLLQSGNMVIALDDMDLNKTRINVSENLKSNYLWVYLQGFITNNHGTEIDKFIKKHQLDNVK